MAPMPSSSSRRPPSTRRRSGRIDTPNGSSMGSPSVAATRSMKRKYVPGGPGGGGRYLEPDGTEKAVGVTGLGGNNYMGSRARVGRENTVNGVPPAETPRPRRESRRERAPARPRFSSAAAAAAAVVQGDGFKPREERGWEEFHQDLDIGAPFPVFSADEVDGVQRPTSNASFDGRNGTVFQDNAKRSGIGDLEILPDKDRHDRSSVTPMDVDSTPRRRPGRPCRAPDSMLKGIGTPEVPKVIPLPGFNPREKLTLPKPSFHRYDPFLKFEEKNIERINYVDKGMAHVGYQEGEMYLRPERNLIRVTEGNIEEDLDMATGKLEGDGNPAIGSSSVGRVEYDMDEQDNHWLEAHNTQRKVEGIEVIKPAIFEITMTKIEKEWHALEKRIPKPNPKPPQTHRPRSSSAAAVNGEPSGLGEEQDSKCAICDDGDCENTNAIVFCDGCDLAVHQECYGVPFIPEGQWLCRKCQLIGRGTPTCIFCPNTDGAFKQTNSSRWAHLLCAIWIPEVSIGNSTFMEPVMDVEKVPRPRWKLTCYICRQKMGACIQCGNKNCYIAFHVTCARRSRLFLKMKSTHGGPASIDASVLKAYCDKHVPADWRREHDVDTATTDAMEYYRYTMRGRLWADSQQSALTMAPMQSIEAPVPDPVEESSNPKLTLNLNPNKRKRDQPPKVVWRLPSGAPVIPQAVYNPVESSLQRFSIRKRKEFASEACKYWTLKREARRGAALLKRLQLQMETFTSMEITRRNFVGMGAAGGVRLQRRIDFAEKLLQDVDGLRKMCAQVKEREHEKLKDAKTLKSILDMVYFPVMPLLWPILEKAQLLDGKGVFKEGFTRLEENLNKRFYTSVPLFSEHFSSVINATLRTEDVKEPHAQFEPDSSTRDGLPDYKYRKALVTRIVKAVKLPFEDALRKESELLQKPFEKELANLDKLLDSSLPARRNSAIPSHLGSEEFGSGQSWLSLGEGGSKLHQSAGSASEDSFRNRNGNSTTTLKDNGMPKNQHPTPDSMPLTNGTTGDFYAENGSEQASSHMSDDALNAEPLTPPISSAGGDSEILARGGVPWYMEPFDPMGTTVQEERWTGRELVRGMSEELSDMDEEQLSGLVGVEEAEATSGSTKEDEAELAKEKAREKKRKRERARRRRPWG